MCFDGEMAKVWHEREVTARKPHVCYECNLPIPVGDDHVRIDSLLDGWETNRVHTNCLALYRLIDKELCGSHGILIGGLGEEIAQQDNDDSDGDWLISTRATLEWLWALATDPYRTVPALTAPRKTITVT